MRKSFRKAGARGKAVLILATWFGVGFAPAAPGTFATLAGLPLVVLMGLVEALPGALLLAGILVLAFWSAHLAAEMAGETDPAEIVIDEVAGILVAFFLIPLSWLNLFSGFILFRLFDIWKPFPVRRAERLRGGVGIVLDDIVAGILANAGIRVMDHLFG